jgi:hypothetical protein
MDAGTIVIIFVVFIVLGLGGWGVYRYMMKPKQCPKQAATDDVATWKWSGGKCIADTCVKTGYTGDDCKTAPTSGSTPTTTSKKRHSKK